MKLDYNPHQIEEKWQQYWEDQQLFQQTENQQVANPEGKMYLLFAFAYPSGSGLHVGHVESKTALDILARYYRMNGKSVFFPVGWDAFGLPAENYAIKTGVHPAETTKQAIDTFRRQIKRIGISYDWANEIATSHPEYYKWTQWIFLQLYKEGLAYQGTGMVNWCPSCQTVLANEQVVNGECERCGSQVIQKELKQWFFKITDYQDELISGLDQVDWPKPTKLQQLNWIGKREGVTVKFKVVESSNTHENDIECFTTRIDTIFGATFVVVSPEKFKDMGLLDHVAPDHRQRVEDYIEQAFEKTEEERQIGEKDKTGVNTGLSVINPVSGEEIPIFVADYVLAGYGTGAVMGVPAHDERDFAFARKHGVDVLEVIKPTDQANEAETLTKPFTEYGILTNSGPFTGMTSEAAQQAIVKEFSGVMQTTTTYKLRDWLISRQRYWGAPIPVVYDPEGNPHPVKEEHLPWELPTDVDFNPKGESPLRTSKEFIERTEKLYGQGWRPEFDTMDTFVDSSWYFLRYLDSRNLDQFADPAKLKQWLPVDLYMIGPEHIVLHLLYSRFFTKFLRDQGYLNIDEPFQKMRHQGMILGPDGKKMSKSKGNVINPDDIIEKFGADTLRVYEMFMGPLEADKPWDVRAVVGVHRFLSRVYSAVVRGLENETPDSEAAQQVRRKLHQTIKKVTQDIPDLKFNTAIAALMELMNTWEAGEKQANGAVLSKEELNSFIALLAPFAPFMAEELNDLSQKIDKNGVSKNPDSIHLGVWPTWDESLAQAETVTIPIQVNGKVRAQLEVAADQVGDKQFVLAQAKEIESLQKWLTGAIVKEIYVPGKIVNFVVS